MKGGGGAAVSAGHLAQPGDPRGQRGQFDYRRGDDGHQRLSADTDSGRQRRFAVAGGSALAMMSIGWPLASTLSGRLMLRTTYRFTAQLGAFC